MTKRLLPVAALALVATVAAFAWKGEALRGFVAGSASLPVLGRVPAFHLVGDDGKAFDSSSLAGRAWLASFLYTSCPGPCPRLVERLKTVRRAIPADTLAIVSFSVDPATDTPDVLATYKASKGIGAGDAWTFVTGPPDTVTDLVQHGFLTGVQRSADSKEEGAVTHGVRVALVDGNGQLRAFYATDSDDDLARLAVDAASLH